MQPGIEQVTFSPIPWTTVQSAIQVAFDSDAANWEIKIVSECEVPEHITVNPTSNPNDKGKPTFLMFADHIQQPSGSQRLVYHVWGPRCGIGNQVFDMHHSLIGVVTRYCDVAATIACHWAAMEIDIRLRAAFDEPEFDPDPAPETEVIDPETGEVLSSGFSEVGF